jgi:hypothetical protein
MQKLQKPKPQLQPQPQLVLQFATFSCSDNAINSSLRLLSQLMHCLSKKQLLFYKNRLKLKQSQGKQSLQKTQGYESQRHNLMHLPSQNLGQHTDLMGQGQGQGQGQHRGVMHDLMHLRHLHSLNRVHVQLKNTRHTKSSTRFTVIRSPFVFKKTREQFVRLHRACTVALPMAKPQQQYFLQLLTTTKFPAELSVLSHV